MRRAAGTLLLATALVLGKPALALACPVESSHEEPRAAGSRARAVFIAHITRTEEGRYRFAGSAEPAPAIINYFRVVETAKGTPPEAGFIVTRPPGSPDCGEVFLAGSDFIVFLQHADDSVLRGDGGGWVMLPDADWVKKLVKDIRAQGN